MFLSVLAGVDGRSNGRDAVALASRLTADEGTLTLSHVHRGRAAAELQESHALLERERTEAGVEAGLLSVVAASPGRGLHEQAEQLGADLLVVGTCSRGALGRAMLGDDTRAALNGAPCAVAVAALGTAERPRPIANVGVAYNGSPESVAALGVAREIAMPSRATVQALEVVAIPSAAYSGLVAPAVGEGIDTMIKEANERMAELSGVQGRAVYGLTGEELAAFSGELDVLVVGSRSYGPVRRLVIGSTSDYLARHARCSLLVLPRTALNQ